MAGKSADTERKKPRRDAGTGGLICAHRCGKKGDDDTWPCGKEKATQCPDRMWIGTLDLGIGGDGKRRRKRVYDRDRNQCAAKLRDARKSYEDGVVTTSSKTTVAQWLRHWLDEIAKPQLKPRVWVTNNGTVVRNIVPHIGAHRLDKLTAAHVREMHKAILADGKSTKTAHNAHTLLSTALTAAVREGVLSRNVAQLVAKPKVLSRERIALTVEQARALLVHCARVEDPMTTRWAAALLLGARQGELLGLTWDRVDLDRGLADISWQLQSLPQVHGCGPKDSEDTWPCGKVQARSCPSGRIDAPPGYDFRQLKGALSLVPPKSAKSVRVVPLPEPLLTGLRQRKEDVGGGAHNLVWTTRGGDPINPRFDREAWSAALSAAGLPQVELHAARHTTASLLATLGVEEVIRMQILGHNSYVANRGYTHIDQSLAASALNRLSQLINPDADGEAPRPPLHLVS